MRPEKNEIKDNSVEHWDSLESFQIAESVPLKENPW